MNKLVPILLLGGGGTAAVATGGVFLFGGAGGGAEEITVGRRQEGAPEMSKQESTSMDEFKRNLSSKRCVSGFFEGGIDPEHNAPDLSASSPSAGVFFKAVQSGDTPFKGCLFVDSVTYMDDDNSKWIGKITWTWTLVKGGEGFINFNVAETTNEAGKLKLTGLFYLVAKENNKWKVKHKKEVAGEGRMVSGSGELGGRFPKVKDAFQKQHVFGGYLGFVGDESGDMYTMDNICTTCSKDEIGPNASDSAAIAKHEFHWTKGGSGNGPSTFGDWCENFGWWTNLYGSEWNVSEKIRGFDGGNWNRITQNHTQ